MQSYLARYTEISTICNAILPEHLFSNGKNALYIPDILRCHHFLGGYMTLILQSFLQRTLKRVLGEPVHLFQIIFN
ncbi:hypothetical protein C9422_18220 [Pseudomonas sp. B1(2018)]|nr:hypothetical protein C9422_18220 [Pseudomonas sp. B1(2018)]